MKKEKLQVLGLWLVVFIIVWLFFKDVVPVDTKATCIDKFVVPNRNGEPVYYIVYRDTSGTTIEKSSYQPHQYYMANIGHTYIIKK